MFVMSVMSMVVGIRAHDCVLSFIVVIHMHNFKVFTTTYCKGFNSKYVLYINFQLSHFDIRGLVVMSKEAIIMKII
jgi:hypothetical protein